MKKVLALISAILVLSMLFTGCNININGDISGNINGDVNGNGNGNVNGKGNGNGQQGSALLPVGTVHITN
jgi:hypothetical protein